LKNSAGGGQAAAPGAGCHLFGSLFSEKTKAAQQLKILITIKLQVAVELNGGELLPLLEFIVDYSYSVLPCPTTGTWPRQIITRYFIRYG
jgi:hypothetical protein